jgi:glucokinase
MERFLLAGDVGGTKTNLALFRSRGRDDVELAREGSYRSRGHAGLDEIVRTFLAEGGESIGAAAFGVAGPVLDGRVTVTNLPWHVDAGRLGAEIGTPHVALMNDLETTAYGALFLPSDRLLALNPGKPRRTHRAAIAAGTGLGQAILFWDGARFRPTATEGGHVGFAPRDDLELELLRYLLGRYPRVSFERVVSGPGLHHIFDFLCDERGAPVEPQVRERMQREDPSAVIGEAGLEGSCAACEQAVDLFVALYGAQAANLVLSSMALGGIYVGGGIVTKLLPKVRSGGFLESFFAAGRFADLMRDTPVWIILDPKASLLGAARAALELGPA